MAVYLINKCQKFLNGLAQYLLILAIQTAPTWAQVEPDFFDKPFAYGQWNIGRSENDFQFRYCIDKRDPDWEISKEIAIAIANTLLLEPVEFVNESQMVVEDITSIYKVFLENCDVYFGFKLLPSAYENWLTITKAYYDSEYVFVSTNPETKRLEDLSNEQPIGAIMGTIAQIRLITYNRALPKEDQYRLIPIGLESQGFEQLLNSKIDALLIWGPSYWARKRSDPAMNDAHLLESEKFLPTTVGVGAILLSDQTFLRASIDLAIENLKRNNVIDQILKQYDFPATIHPNKRE